MGRTLWLNGCEYNTARVIERLADIVIERGGRVKTCEDGMEIRTRGYHGRIESIEKDIERIEFMLKDKEGVLWHDGKEETRARLLASIEKLKGDIRELERQEEEAPRIKSCFMSRWGLCAGCISFVLDHVYYHFEFADNPFFPDHFQKIRLNDQDEYIGIYYGEYLVPEDKPKDYYRDELWTPCADEEIINAVAEDIYERLLKKPFPGRCMGDYKYVNVPNTYNDEYHRERVCDTDNKRRRIDF